MNARPLSLRVLPVIVALVAVWVWWNLKIREEPEVRKDTAEDVLGAAKDFTPYKPSERTEEKVSAPEFPLPEGERDVIPGEYTVFFKDAAALEEFLAKSEANGLRVLGTLPELLAVRVGASQADLSRLLGEDAQIDLNYRVRVPGAPDLELWQNYDLAGFDQEMLTFLGIPNSPERLNWGDGVTIAVLDTGWLGHSSVDEGSVRQIDLIGSMETGIYAGHGTAVAGLIGSTNPFAPGISPGGDILAIRVLDGDGRGDAFTLAQGIIVAVDNGAAVINMSLGGYGDSTVLQQAVNYATLRGVVLVAASGNDGVGTVTYPAAYASVIGVSAVDANGNRAPFSNYGEGIDVAAPGYQVHALWENDEYIYFDGTSASAPLVAAMVARVIQQDLATGPQEVSALIKTQANDTGPPGDDTQYGAGILNAERIQSVGQSGIFDMALADLYPAVEESDGATFPLYVTFENRGTEFVAGTTVEISVNEQPYYYKFSGISPGEVESVQIPVDESQLEQGIPLTVNAKIKEADQYVDSNPSNNEGKITLQKPTGG